eukprot:PITA_19695
MTGIETSRRYAKALDSSILLNANQDYKDALSKSILFFEGQRSGILPPNQRLTWRKDSALKDGSDQKVDLVGGYYDAGDNIKFGFPMAFTATMLSWSVLEFGDLMGQELENAKAAIRWATDYFLKAAAQPDKLFVQVGDPTADHNCWERPEDMDTPRTVYSIDVQNPGSEVSGETAAAMAAASIVFQTSDLAYSQRLLHTATQLFAFADRYRGAYSDSLRSAVCPFYCDYSGYQDELLWAAAWLHKASTSDFYLLYIQNNGQAFGADNGIYEFGWDDKHAGINVLLSKDYLAGNVSFLMSFKRNADSFICYLLPGTSSSPHVQLTPGGLISKSSASNMQSVTSISFLALAYAKYLSNSSQSVRCGSLEATPASIWAFAKRQIDYILGENPLNLSYMVGYGSRFPQRIHHRASSMPSIQSHPGFIGCKNGSYYYNSDDPNPNLLIGAVVGGPDENDQFPDDRSKFEESEPTTYINAPLVGALAFFSANPNPW